MLFTEVNAAAAASFRQMLPTISLAADTAIVTMESE